MAHSVTFQSSSFGRDPLAELEHSRAESAGRKMSKRELSEMGNRPLSDSGRRTPDDDAKAAREPLEAFLAKESQPKKWSAARKAAEALFTKPGDHDE
jgi:hypothetical protein